MSTYCYTLSADGRESSLQPAECPDKASAIEHGRVMLLAAIEATRPAAAYVAVFEDEGADDEPLGAWDWSREAPDPVWSAED